MHRLHLLIHIVGWKHLFDRFRHRSSRLLGQLGNPLHEFLKLDQVLQQCLDAEP